jgi:hypothetical protein
MPLIAHTPKIAPVCGQRFGKLYRPMAGHGGIVVLRYRVGDKWDVHIHSLETLTRELQDNHSVHSLSLRIVLERLTIARNHAHEVAA